ncbi:conserved hypothetical protein [Frankia alni ACN14a]|uniref:Uncharacterized protein n=1 Tax=Frankia alni (strain DSM 45986 / CECT 9034 / ACN14a) TaxID=326424 RepID=Q0RQJ1_FRAAA|nr:conserved hypothetical protein [Frankia alni ACN14a]
MAGGGPIGGDRGTGGTAWREVDRPRRTGTSRRGRIRDMTLQERAPQARGIATGRRRA